MNNESINHILFYCGNFKRDEKLLLIYDNISKDIFYKFKKFLDKQDIKYDSSITKNSKTHGKNLGKIIEKKMIRSDLILCLTKNSFAHSRERLKSEKKGIRFLSLVNFSSKKLKLNSLIAPFKNYSKKAKKLKKILDKGKTVEVISLNGVRLIADINKRKSNFCPGFVNNNILLGSPPDVETNISPIEHKSNGEIIVDGSISTNNIGKLKSKIILKIKNGCIEKFYTSNKSLSKKFNNIFYKYSNKRKVLAEIGFGFNKKSEITGHMLCDEGAYGCVHFGFGSNYTVGGKNKIDFHIDMILKKPTVLIDNKIILKNNIYKIK